MKTTSCVERREWSSFLMLSYPGQYIKKCPRPLYSLYFRLDTFFLLPELVHLYFRTYSMWWVSDSSEIVFQLVVIFDFSMCKFLSGAFGCVVTSLQPISNIVLFKLFLYGGTSIFDGLFAWCIACRVHSYCFVTI